MLIKNVQIRGRQGFWDIAIRDKLIEKIDKNIESLENEEVIDGNGAFVMPPYVDSHCHLDYVATYGDPTYNMSGTLLEGIGLWGERKKKITKEDIRQRTTHVVKWLVAQGTQFVRTHVNSDEPGLKSLETMLELREELRDIIDIQIVAFPQHGIYNFENGLDLLKESLVMGADVVGAIPHFEDLSRESSESIKEIFELAVKYDKLVDVHCDESDDPHSRAIEAVATHAYRTGLHERVTASHTCAMHSYNDAFVDKLFGIFEKARLNFVSNPTINMHLQGRYGGYPKIRGLTRVKELSEAGLNVSFGNDDIMDPFYPLGRGDMLEVLHMGLHACHLTGYTQILDSFDFITTNGARTLNITDRYGIEEGKPGSLIILEAENEYDIVRRHVKPTYSIRNGQVISHTKQAQHKIFKSGKEEEVDFRV